MLRKWHPDPQLGKNQVGPFLVASAPLLAQHTSGYGLWTYRNFNFSPVFNPSFSLLKAGWHVKSALVHHTKRGSKYLAMHRGSSANQRVKRGPAYLTATGQASVSVHVAATKATSLTVDLSNHLLAIAIKPGSHNYLVKYPASDFGDGSLTLTANGTLDLSNVQLYGFTQTGDVYNTNGKPEFTLSPLRQLNQDLEVSG